TRNTRAEKTNASATRISQPALVASLSLMILQAKYTGMRRETANRMMTEKIIASPSPECNGRFPLPPAPVLGVLRRLPSSSPGILSDPEQSVVPISLRSRPDQSKTGLVQQSSDGTEALPS